LGLAIGEPLVTAFQSRGELIQRLGWQQAQDFLESWPWQTEQVVNKFLVPGGREQFCVQLPKLLTFVATEHGLRLGGKFGGALCGGFTSATSKSSAKLPALGAFLKMTNIRQL